MHNTMLRFYQVNATEEILTRFREGQFRISNLANPPGSGHTRIAVEVLRRVNQRPLQTPESVPTFASHYLTLTGEKLNERHGVLIVTHSTRHNIFQWKTELAGIDMNTYTLTTFAELRHLTAKHNTYSLVIIDTPLTRKHAALCNQIDVPYCLVLSSYISPVSVIGSITFRGARIEESILKRTFICTLTDAAVLTDYHIYQRTIYNIEHVSIETSPQCCHFMATEKYTDLLLALGSFDVLSLKTLTHERAQSASWYQMLVNSQRTTRPNELLANRRDYDAKATCPCCFGQTPRTLTICNHAFCAECIFKWLSTSNSTCPVCRHPLQYEDLIVERQADRPQLNFDHLLPFKTTLLRLLRYIQRTHVVIHTGWASSNTDSLAHTLRTYGYFATSMHKTGLKQKARILEDFLNPALSTIKVLLISQVAELANLDGLQNTVQVIINLKCSISTSHAKYLKSRVIRLGLTAGSGLYYYNVFESGAITQGHEL